MYISSLNEIENHYFYQITCKKKTNNRANDDRETNSQDPNIFSKYNGPQTYKSCILTS